MNNLLSKENSNLVSLHENNNYPIYFIIAQPRGASTLFQQLITSNLHIGYISNFLAKFYQAPAFGIELEKDIINKDYKSNYISSYGNTKGINEPHEWGWFWKEQLNLKDNEHYCKKQNFDNLKTNLNFIVNTKKLPLIIDNVYAMANILKFKDNFKNIRIINLTRDLYFICNSIINARISRYDNINHFYGHIPNNISVIQKIKNPIEQIVFQVKSIQDEIDLITTEFKNAQLTIDYEEIYNNSFEVVQKFKDFVKNSDSIELKEKEKHLPKLNYRNSSNLINNKYKDELDYFYKKYFGKRND
ncbi:hypothetical protein [Malaciobacter halophilus]|nr:hypothetical protein [Malaciobacter halophilus]